ncbi:hypothetical protein V8C35DRAFT_329388 [Trichoderma chlorosporum]
MVKRGRPSLNLTPEERIQRRRLQLVASQRKRRAHKRLAQQPKASTESPDSPARPDEEALCRFYDAMFRDGDATDAARNMSSSDPQAPLSVCHNCGSAPLDMAALTAVVSAHSPASLMRASHLRTATHAPSSRLAGPRPSSTWDEYLCAIEIEPDKSGIDHDYDHDHDHDHDSFTQGRLAHAYSDMPLLDSIVDLLVPPGISLDACSLLGDLAPTSHPDKASAPTPAKQTDNVFLLGRFSTANNEWMPTNGNEPSYAYEKAIASRRPPSPSSSPDETGSTLSDDFVHHLAPWAGAKQAIFMGL